MGSLADSFTGFTFRWPLAGVLVLLVLVIAWSVARGRSKRSRWKPGAAMPPVWTLEDDMSGTLVDKRYRRWIHGNKAAVALLAICGILAAGLAARPSAINRDNTDAARRDIVLCLDVSASTLPYDAQILATYQSLVEHFSGERIGLSIFNSTSRTVFPLTDDYSLVKDQLSYASGLLQNVTSQANLNAMSDQDYNNLLAWLDGTENVTDSSSLIGDGLVSCATMLPEFTLNADREKSNSASSTAERSGMILLATDNMVAGTEIYTLQQGLDLAHQSGIAVDALYAGDPSMVYSSEAQDMQNLIQTRGGVYEAATSDDAVDNLVRDIDSRSKESEETDRRADRRDTPALLLAAVALLWLAYLAIEGALKR
ncbi:MAG: VWA domain-containing protein [Bifidobacteriaceae bacterium]|nr:VWA domain-containing protein [Bifidobacteriaceae bacterium]